MACTLSNIPGYEKVIGDAHFKENSRKLQELLTRLLGKKDAHRFLSDPHLSLCSSREAFPEVIRRRIYTTEFPPFVLYDYTSATLYIAVNGVNHPGFLSRLLAEAGWYARLTDESIQSFRFHLNLTDTPSLPRIFLSAKFRESLDCNWMKEAGRSAPYYVLLEILVRENEALFSHDCKVASIKEVLDFALTNIRKPLPDYLRLSSSGRLPMKSVAGLSSVFRIAPYALPSIRNLFAGAQAQRLMLFSYTQAIPKERHGSSFGLAPCYVNTEDDLAPLDALSDVEPIEDFSLHPMARLTPKLCNPEESGTVNLLQNFFADFPYEKVSRGALVPYIPDAPTKTMYIEGADVSPKLDWAVLKLHLDRSTTSIRALHSLWAMQASRLKTRTPYEVDIAFWATEANPVAGEEKTKIKAKPDDFPTTHLKVTFQKYLDKQWVARIDYVTFKCTSSIGPLLVAIPKKALSKAEFRKGQKLFIDGFFLAGEFREEAMVDVFIHNLMVNSKNHHRGMRELGLHPFRHTGMREFYRAIAMTPRSEYFRKLRWKLLEAASEKGCPAAMTLFAKAKMTQRKGDFAEIMLAMNYLGKAVATGFKEALRFLSFAGGPNVFPADCLREILCYLATEYDDPHAEFDLYKAFQKKLAGPVDPKEAFAETAWLVQCATHNVEEAIFLLAKVYALGLGVTQNKFQAHFTLERALQNGVRPAQYWFAAYSRFEEKFFTLSEKEKETGLKELISSGIPYALILLGLFYQYESTNRRAPLLSYALFREAANVMHDDESLAMSKRAKERLTSEMRKELSFLEIWKELGVAKPAESIAIKEITAVSFHENLYWHPFFAEKLDPTCNGSLTPKLRQQIQFIIENSNPVSLGLLREEKTDEDRASPSRVFGFGAAAGATDFSRSMILWTPGGEKSELGWNLPPIYPVFKDGSPLNLYINRASENPTYDCGILEITPYSDALGPGKKLLAFDPLWGALKNRYRTNERYKANFYGIAKYFDIGCDPLEDLPPEVVARIREIQEQNRAKNLAVQNIIGIGAVDPENVIYRIDSIVLSVEDHYTELFSVPYIRIKVAPFISQEYGADYFTIFVPKNGNFRFPRAGERIRAEVELHVLILEAANIGKTTLN